jgi:hypothetical protein
MRFEPDLGPVEGEGPLFPVKDHRILDEANIAPGLGGAPGGLPVPLDLTGAHDGRPPDERERPLFPKKSTTSQPTKQTSVLGLPLIPGLCVEGLYPFSSASAVTGSTGSRDRAVALSLDAVR